MPAIRVGIKLSSPYVFTAWAKVPEGQGYEYSLKSSHSQAACVNCCRSNAIPLNCECSKYRSCPYKSRVTPKTRSDL